MCRVFLFLAAAFFVISPPSSRGQAPASEKRVPTSSEITLSLKVMQKALANCRDKYSQKRLGESDPLAKLVIGSEGYANDLKTLETAQTFISAMLDDPSRISGQGLVAVLSTSDDFARGAASTQSEILLRVIAEASRPTSTDSLLIFATSLQGCSKELFDAGDEFVGIVLSYVSNKDALAAACSHSPIR